MSPPTTEMSGSTRILETLANSGGKMTPRELSTALGHKPTSTDMVRLRAFQQITGSSAIAITPAGQRRLARHYNMTAQLHPADPANVGPTDPQGSGELPCIEIAEMQTYMYIDESGKLQVSIHLDGGDQAIPAWMRAEDGTIPLTVTVNNDDVYTGGPAWPGTGLDVECLIRTAVELWKGGVDVDLSDRQKEQLGLASIWMDQADG